jgi:CHASE2 domain-containing sensor protein
MTKPAVPKYVWLIAITDDDYDKLFQGTSPLDRQTLAKIIQVTAEGQPSVIGVDVDTSKSRIDFSPKVLESATLWPPIIWARNAKQEGGLLKPDPVFGGADPQPFSALGLFPIDSNDQIVRRYNRTLPTTEGEKETLPWALVKMFCSHQTDPTDTTLHDVCQRLEDPVAEHQESPLIVAFSEKNHLNTRQISAGDLLAQEGKEGWKKNSPLKGQIALIGGTFRESADWYETPFGRLPGAELIAQAVEAELQHRTIALINEVFMLLVEITGGFILVLWQFFAPAWIGFTLRVLALPLLAIGSSCLVFLSAVHWANFAPILVGVICHECYDHWREFRTLRAKAEGQDR